MPGVRLAPPHTRPHWFLPLGKAGQAGDSLCQGHRSGAGGRRDLNLGLLQTKTYFHPTILPPHTGTRESINSYSLIRSNIPSPPSLSPSSPTATRSLCPPPQSHLGGTRQEGHYSLCPRTAHLLSPRAQPCHRKENDNGGGDVGSLGPKDLVSPVTSAQGISQTEAS